MREIITSTDELCPSVSTIYAGDMKKLELAGERGSPDCKVLNVSSIIGAYDPISKKIIILDGNHRAKEADRRDLYLPCIVLETVQDCYALSDEFIRKATKGVLTGDGIASLFKAVHETAERMYSLACGSVYSIKIEDGTYFDRVKASRGFDFL